MGTNIQPDENYTNAGNLVPCNGRLKIKEDMTTDYVREHGNAAQKAAICIFDKDANGVFDKEEAALFNSRSITFTGDELRLYERFHKQGEPAKLVETVDYKKAEKEYQQKADNLAECKKRQEKYEAEQAVQDKKAQEAKERLTPKLAPYGIVPDYVCEIFDDAKEVTKDGKKYLVLTSSDFGFELSMPLDETFKNPEKIMAFYTGEGYLPRFYGVSNGTLRQTIANPPIESTDILTEKGYLYFKDCNLEVIGKYGHAEYISVGEGSHIKFTTDDWADSFNGESVQPGTYEEPKPEKK